MTQPQHNHCVGDQPTNPIITEKWVYRISNIQREYPPEDDGLIHWSYDIDEQIPIVEYTKRRESEIAESISIAKAEATTDAFEATLEIVGGV